MPDSCPRSDLPRSGGIKYPIKWGPLNNVDTWISSPANWLKGDKSKAAIPMAITKDRKQAISDSTRNWAIKLFFRLPNTFRTPTSFARLAEQAVERFIKLMQAINKIKIAMAEKIYILDAPIDPKFIGQMRI